jgi:competence ComEA-like helix-hairpin-helix protein
MKTASTRWFELSGKELLVLLAGTCIVLLSFILLELARSFLWRPAFEVEETREVLSAPPRLDLNTVKEYELTLLPGIGPKTARAIIEYRDVHGGFSNLEELVKVRGIGPRQVELLRPHLMCAPVQQGKQDRDGSRGG